jgi:hypothetical protein
MTSSKITLLLIFPLFIFSTNIVAQVRKDTVGIADFSTQVPGASQFLNLFTEKTVGIINTTGRFFLVDLTSAKSVDKIVERAQENYKGNWINTNAKINPKVVFIGQINVLKFIRIASNATPGYKSNVQFVLKIIETESSKILDSYEFSGLGSSISLTQEGSIQEAINNMGPQIGSWINLKFPIQLPLIKILKQSNKSIEEVIIGGGSGFKLNSGDSFNIVYLDDTFSPPIPQIIGEATIIDVLNENYSSVKIISGDRNQIKDLFINHKNLILFKSK